jgi:hypothetical protein
MAAQTLGNPLADRPLVLNGPLVRLGLADDILHEGSGGAVSFGFGLFPVTGVAAAGTWRANVDRVEVDTSLSIAKGGQDLKITQTTIEVHQQEPLEEKLTLSMTSRTRTAAANALRDAGLLRDPARDATAKYEDFDVTGPVPSVTAGVRARQFLPDRLIAVLNQYEEELWWSGTGLGYRRAGRAARVTAATPVSPEVLNFVREFLESEFGADEAAEMAPPDALTAGRLWGGLSPEATEALQGPAFERYLKEHSDALGYRGALDFIDLPPGLDSAVDFVRRWFQSRVRHLGPLRAEPQPIHGLPEAASGTSVGRSGEYTAAVLSAHGNRRVVSPNPEGPGERQISLQDAVNEWMGAMNLLSSVHAEEQGKLGYELHLRVEGVKRDLDLTTVGVGVSQALPVVVLGLITPPGSLLLFEQPELHLHPDVQAALGDFFLALARTGRQLIVETHSEYLVNRLRRRAATEPEFEAQDLTRLFFFERSGDASEVRSVRIGPGGTMPGWPRGFLDTAAREIEAMASAFRG